ncbi:MAG TPA: MarR family transcriptional regulator [Candidatus Limnocylindrales bacterium]|nr:MarR family transcriptional regulator [Candidatus Limnocylindrales bacterium]
MSQASVDEALAGYKRVHRALLTSTASRWRDIDISMPQLRALYFLRDQGDVSIGGLAELFDISMPAASLLADRLVRAGFAERREDPADRRRVLLGLTRSGARLVTDLREGSYGLLRRWMSSLSHDDLEALSRGWRALAEAATHQGSPAERATV